MFLKIKVSNPSIKNIFYQLSIIGPNAENFSLPNGHHLPINAKCKTNLTVNFVGNNLKSGNAYLLLTGKKQSSHSAETLVFCLNASIDELTSSVNIFDLISFKIIKFSLTTISFSSTNDHIKLTF